MWVSWSDTLSGCLASGNRRKSSRLQLLTANHKLLKILLTNCVPKSLSKKTWSGGEALLISLLASVEHGARGVTRVRIRPRREHTGPVCSGNPSIKARSGQSRLPGTAADPMLRPSEDIIVQTSSSAISDSLIIFRSQTRTWILFLLTPTPNPLGVSHPLTSLP